MTSKALKALTNRDNEIMVISKTLADEIRKLKGELNTSYTDVLSAALELLKHSVNREITFREPRTGKESSLRIVPKNDTRNEQR